MTQIMRPVTNHDTDLVADKFFSYLDEDKEFVYLLRTLISEYTVCLIGGSIRDIINQTTPRDFDLIIDTDNETLRSHFSAYILKINSFGGLKCITKRYTIDIWSFNDNWAFKTGLLDKQVENIPSGAFYNIDALVLDLSKKRLYFEHYNRCVRTKVLDFVSHDTEYLNSNPTPAQNVLKSYYVKCKYNLNFSREVLSYIEEWKNSNDDYVHDIINAEIKHFGHEIYKIHEINVFLSNKSCTDLKFTSLSRRKKQRLRHYETFILKRKNPKS